MNRRTRKPHLCRLSTSLLLTALLIVVAPFGAAMMPDDETLGWGLHPGATMAASGHLCSLSFMVRNETAIGYLTAGHCVGPVGTIVEALKTERHRIDDFSTAAGHALALADCPRFESPNLVVPQDCLNAHVGPALTPLSTASFDRVFIGHVVSARYQDTHGDDYALIQLDPSVEERASPVIPGFGAPCGLGVDPPFGAPVISDASGTGLASSPRATLLTAFAYKGFETAGPHIGGDSGSPIMTVADRYAVGILTWAAPGVFVNGNGVSFPVVGPIKLGTNGGGTSIQRALDANPGWELVLGANC